MRKKAISTSRLAPARPEARSRITNGQTILPNIDGRSVVARRYRDLCAALVTDSGGIEACSESRLQLIRRFAALAVQAEALEARLANGEQIDLSEHALISSTLVRLVSRLGIARRAKTVPSLTEYLAAKEQEHVGSD